MKLKTIVLTICLLVFPLSAGATDYYLDVNLGADCTGGDYSIANRACDGADGNAYNALADLNAVVSAGDTVYIRAGTYNDPTYNAASDGSSGSEITFTNYASESIIFEGGINILIDQDYHIFENITMQAITSIGNTRIRITGMYNIIRDCTIDGNGSDYAAIVIWGTAGDSYEGYNEIVDCTISNFGDLSGDGGEFGIGIGYGGAKSHHNKITDCIFEEVESYCLVLYGGSMYNEITGCTFDINKPLDANDYGLGISINDNEHSGITSYNLIDNNVIKHFGWGSGTNKAGIQLYGDYNTIRRNRIYDGGDNGGGALEIACAANNLIYNNTFYDSHFGMTFGSTRVTGNTFKNNIWYKNHHETDANGYQEGCQHAWVWVAAGYANAAELDAGNGNLFDHNFIQYEPATGNDPVMQCDTPVLVYTLTEAETNLSATYTNNIEQTDGPVFTNEAGNDFTLASPSPCIDAGVVVTDVTWGNLSHKGTAPDIGAYESSPAVVTGTIIPGGCTESEIVSGGKTIVVTISGTTLVATFGADNQITTDFIDGFDSAQSEAGGWDATMITANVLTYEHVVRTDANTATVTLPACAAYQITSAETITLTIPASSVEGDDPITATPGFVISAEQIGAESVSATYDATGPSIDI